MNFMETLDHNFESTEKTSEDDSSKGRSPLWIDKDNLEVVSYPAHNLFNFVSPLDYGTCNGEIRRYKKINKRLNTGLRIQEDKKSHKRSHSDETTHEHKSKRKRSKNNLRYISYSFINNYKKRIATSNFGSYGLKTKRKIKEYKTLQSTSSKPVRMINSIRLFSQLNLMNNNNLSDSRKFNWVLSSKFWNSNKFKFSPIYKGQKEKRTYWCCK